MMAKVLSLDLSTIAAQTTEPIEDIYVYMDHVHKRVLVHYNDEKALKLNIVKLGLKRLNIKDFWNEIIDVKITISDNFVVLTYIEGE